MGFNARKTLRVGPLALNFTQRGFSSWGLRAGRWSWNSKTGRHTINTPGPGSFSWGGKAAGKAASAVKRKFAGEHMCESCRKRVGYQRSNRMYQCRDCMGSTRKLGGGFSLERRNFPRGHSVRADRQRGVRY